MAKTLKQSKPPLAPHKKKPPQSGVVLPPVDHVLLDMAVEAVTLAFDGDIAAARRDLLERSREGKIRWWRCPCDAGYFAKDELIAAEWLREVELIQDLEFTRVAVRDGATVESDPGDCVRVTIGRDALRVIHDFLFSVSADDLVRAYPSIRRTAADTPLPPVKPDGMTPLVWEIVGVLTDLEKGGTKIFALPQKGKLLNLVRGLMPDRPVGLRTLQSAAAYVRKPRN